MRTTTIDAAVGVAIAILLALVCGAATDRAAAPTSSFAFGCDDFAYQRQAELIRKRGLLRGLDTRIGGPDAENLFAVARTSGLPEVELQKVLGPHCHHVDAHSGRLIAQYPPGTPLVLSLFPRGTAGYGAYLVLVVMTCLAGLLILTLGCPSAAQIGVAALFAMEGCRYFSMPLSWASYSVGITAGLTLLAPALLLVDTAKRWTSGLRLGAIGLLSGLLVAVRLPNVFVVVGLAILIVGRLDLYRPGRLRVQGVELAVGAVAFLVSGPGFVATSNWINTGSPFHTTYGPWDAARSVWSLALLAHHARFYLVDGDAATLTDMSLAVVALSAFVAASGRTTVAFRWAAASALVTTVIALVFFFTHEITAPYYLVPSAIFSVVAPAMTRMSLHDELRLPPMRWGALVGAALLTLVAACRAPSESEPPPFTFAIPPEVVAPGAIVWEDLTSGSLLYYNGKLATKINWASPCGRSRLIAAAHLDGHPQYIIDDSPEMHDDIEALSKSAVLTRIGTYDVSEELPIYRIDDVSHLLDGCPRNG